jgi:hypothetical protein
MVDGGSGTIFCMKGKELREWLVKFLEGGQAFMTFDEAVADFPMDSINLKAPKVTYTFWHILEHLRITQWDILDFSRNPKYVYIKWPDAYWPAHDAKATPSQWKETVASFKSDLQEMIELVKNPKTDLFTPLLWGQGQNILREAILTAEHNAYHIGEFSILRQVTSTWPKGHK